MRILLVKTSSLGDVVHNLPVVADLKRMFPEVRIDWCVEEAFADIPRLHPGVGEIIPVALRRWKKSPFSRSTWRQIGAFRRQIGDRLYDAIIDTQGLVKSAIICAQAHGRRYGYAAEVARERLAARFYDETFVIPPNAHAVERNRWLVAAAMNGALELPLDYGIEAPALDFPSLVGERYALFFTATSRADKLWDEAHWITFGEALAAQGVTAILPAGSAPERARAERIAAAIPGAVAAPQLSLHELGGLIGACEIAIGVDTGLIHLATALGAPTIALFLASDPTLTGVYGSGFFRNLGAPGAPPTPAEVLAVAEQGLRP